MEKKKNENIIMHDSRQELVFEKRIPGLRVSEAKRHQYFNMRSRHVHETIELFFLIEGSRFIFADRSTYKLEAGMGMLVKQNVIHKTSIAEGCAPDHRNFILQLERGTFDELLTKLGYPSFDEFGELFMGVTRFTKEEWDTIMHVIELFKQACEASTSIENAKEVNSFLILQALELLGIYAHRRKAELMEGWKKSDGIEGENTDTHVVNSGVHQKVHDIAMFLQNNCSENLSLEEIADKFFMSKSYLTRIFRNVTGFSIVEYTKFMRVKKSQELLETSDMSITQIAEIAGFGNITYFEKVFHSITGTTPKQYRKKKKEA